MRVSVWVGVVGLAVMAAACGGGTSTPAGDGAGMATPGAAGSGPSGSGAAGGPVAAAVETRTIPAGTALSVRLGATVSSETAQPGDAVRGTVAKAVSVGGGVVIPAGAAVTGQVVDARRAGRVQGRSSLSLVFLTVTVGGRAYDIQSGSMTREGQATKGEDAKKVGIGAGAGAVVGAILGGGKGAAKGAAVGAAGGTGVVLATRGEEVSIEAGSAVDVVLTAPLALPVQR